ncbi:MAG: sulfatase family protein [Acidimicrobiales bacterium]
MVTDPPPNVVVILTDDQRWDTTWLMPNLQAELVDHGVTFNSAFVVNSWCCPSRATHLTGQYSHTSGIYTNNSPHGGATGFRTLGGDQSTLATWLDGAGYRTALIGKYLNGYASSTTKPPGWDRWVAFKGNPSYYNYTLNVDRTAVSYGSTTTDYSTDVLTAYADDFIRSTEPTDPLYLFYTPFSGHVPYYPAPRHTTALSEVEPYRPPNYNEADVSDKPLWVQSLQSYTPKKTAKTDKDRLNAMRSLLATDDGIGTIVAALQDTGRLSNTILIFASDHGLSVGEHRWTAKETAYEENIHVPLIIRYDPLVSAPRTDNDDIVLNIDLAATIAEVAGVSIPPTDGTSLVPLLTSSATSWRDDFLIEHLSAAVDSHQTDKVPTFCAVRNHTHIYVKYQTGEEELYDLIADPFELTNLASDPTYESIRAAMHARMLELCTPPPPGFTP